MKVFLDDNREISYIKPRIGNYIDGEWVICRDYFDFVKLVDDRISEIEFVSFDHDLACFDSNGNEYTGKNAVEYLIDKCIEMGVKFPNWYVHTNNVSGNPNIKSHILNYLKHFESFSIDWKYFNNGIIDGNIIK